MSERDRLCIALMSGYTFETLCCLYDKTPEQMRATIRRVFK